MNFYIGNSINDININDYNVELDDELLSFINDFHNKTAINVNILYDIDPYDDIVIHNSKLTELLNLLNSIISSNLLIEYDDFINIKSVLTDLIELINCAVRNGENLISIGD